MAKLLIVDDDEDLRELLAEFLAGQGHEVRAASDGDDGLHLLARDLPDAVLLDVEMPRLSGPAMAARMLVQDAGLERIPILLFSAGAELPQVALELGTPYYLAKPVDPARLIEMLSRVLLERVCPTHKPSYPSGGRR